MHQPEGRCPSCGERPYAHAEGGYFCANCGERLDEEYRPVHDPAAVADGEAGTDDADEDGADEREEQETESPTDDESDGLVTSDDGQ